MKNLFEEGSTIISNIDLGKNEDMVMCSMSLFSQSSNDILFINAESYQLSVLLISVEKDKITHAYFSCDQDFYSLNELKEDLYRFEKIPWQSSGETLDVYTDIMLGLHDVQNTGLIDMVKDYIIND